MPAVRSQLTEAGRWPWPDRKFLKKQHINFKCRNKCQNCASIIQNHSKGKGLNGLSL